ncbi:hypothetical protein J7E83_05710 [Arthrobacter sp. ISL-48]|uniref:hypothetical protein n=1 Tax=Arthrobacter sp. ISL-48 TaxID=2819110 RepID=UPI001BEC3034|nr:hypothetical protein [Arthrobacter sp. ISL-48]MBT2531624.1 hypothetical protein [Arthrobacter sp. ISL-48]
MLPYELALAALRDGRRYAKRAEQPVRLKTYSGASLEIPGPLLLAEVYALPWLRSGVDAYRSGSALLTRPLESGLKPLALHQGALSDELLAALQRLPELATTQAGRPYRNLRLYLTEATPAARTAYLAQVVAHLRRLLPVYRPPASEEERTPAKTDAERKAASRERVRQAEEASAREWLKGFLTGWDGDVDTPAPGSRWIASELYETAAEVIGDYVEDEEEREDGGLYAVPRQRVFYAVADELLGARRRGAKGSAMLYLIPGA